jgi:ABC-2 type transport system permease protein
MRRAFLAELGRLLRRRVLVGAAITILVFAVGGAAVVLAAAAPASRTGGAAPRLTVEALSGAGGGTEVFRFAVAFAGTLTFVVFVGLFALELARGTFRTMLLRQPRRIRLLAGKLGAMVAFTGAALAVTEVVMWVAALVEAPAFGVSTSAWTSLDALTAGLGDLGTVLVWATGYAVLGMTVALLLRSVPLALAVGIAWAGPMEHLLADAWAPAQRFFPGLLLEAVGQGGTTEVSFSRAMATALGYVAVAAVVSAVTFSRRDATG